MPWVLLLLSAVALAAPDRLPQTVDDAHHITLDQSAHPRAEPAYDQGPVDPTFQINFATLLFRPRKRGRENGVSLNLPLFRNRKQRQSALPPFPISPIRIESPFFRTFRSIPLPSAQPDPTQILPIRLPDLAPIRCRTGSSRCAGTPISGTAARVDGFSKRGQGALSPFSVLEKG